MSVYILMTKFDPPNHIFYAKGYWYRTGYGRHSAEWIEDSLLKELEDNIIIYERSSFPGIGVYYDRYEDLYPCYIKVSNIVNLTRYAREIHKDLYIYYIRFYGDLIAIPSKEFIEILEKLKLRPNNKLFFRISINDWRKVKEELNKRGISIYEPPWWIKLLQNNAIY